MSVCYNCGMDYEECACYRTYAPYKNRTEERVVAGIYLRELLIISLGVLTDRETRVVCLRFGLLGEREHVLREIGYELDVTGNRIRQILAKALRKMEYNFFKEKEMI